MIINSTLQTLIEDGRRRRLFQSVCDHLVVALAAVFAGAILLLLVGTQILDWYWLALLFVGAFGYGLWTVVRKAPSRYQIAQLLDERLHLYDAVSTAFHFAGADQWVSAEVREAQSMQAQEAAAGVDVRAALPFEWPRHTLWAAGLAMAALSLFGVRYLVTQSMDTKPSLVAMAFENFFTPAADKDGSQQAKNSKKNKYDDPDMEKLGIQVNNAETKRDDLDPGNDATNIVDTPDVNNPDNGDNGKSKSKTDKIEAKAEGKDSGDEEGEKGKEGAESKDKDSGDQGDNSSGDSKQQQKADKQKQDKNGEQKGDKSSLMDKMKDAMQNMLNKLKQEGQQQKSGQQQNAKDGQQNGKGQQKSDDKGQQDKNGQQQSGQGEQQDQKAEAQGQQGQKQENAQGKGGDQGKQPQSPDSKSGVGKSDGNKDIEAAENAKAMGKISEILGKRQKDISGEMMIEVSSGKQQLKTSYSGQTSSHKESGGEINRDEVPLIYQQYVEKYFDQIRGTSGTKPATPGEPVGAVPPGKPGGALAGPGK